MKAHFEEKVSNELYPPVQKRIHYGGYHFAIFHIAKLDQPDKLVELRVLLLGVWVENPVCG